MATSEDLEVVCLTKNKSSADEDEEEEEEVQFQIVPKKRGVRRKGNTYRAPRLGSKNTSPIQNVLNEKSLYPPALCFFTIGLTLWIFALTWVAVQLRIEMQKLKMMTDKVSAGNEAIPDSIQRCHSLTRQLEKNQTKIIVQIEQVSQRLSNFSTLIANIQADLANVEKKLNDSPELVTNPKTLRSLMSSIANIGGQLNDFNITTSKVSNEQRKVLDVIDTIMKNLTTMNDDLVDLREYSMVKQSAVSNQNNSAMIVQSVLEKINPNITMINNTLSSYIHWISEDQKSSQKSINDLKDEYEDCKSQIMTIKDEQESHSKQMTKTINEMKVDSTQIKKDVNDCKSNIENSETYLKNITSQLSSCLQACQTDFTPTALSASAPTPAA